MDYYKRAQEIQDEMVKWRRYLHEHAETGMEVSMTAAFVKEKLSEFGYEPKEICKNGIVATVGKPGSTILLRADMDALPMTEESGLAFASKTGNAHTCGHDLHTAALLGTALMLKENEDQLQGTVKLMFQPAEEILIGCRTMVEAGVLEYPLVNAAFAAHVTPRYETGQIALRKGVAMASCYGFRIHVEGFSAHGCYPEQSISPINIATHIYMGLQELIARETDPMKSAVLTIGSFHSGSMPNTIPGDAYMEGTLRTFDQELNKFLMGRITDVAEKTAQAYRGKAWVEELWSVPIEYNDEELTDKVCRYYHDLFSKDAVEDILIAGSEDFAVISQLVPTVDLYIGATPREALDSFYPSHHPKIIFDENVLSASAALNAKVAQQWLEDKGGL